MDASERLILFAFLSYTRRERRVLFRVHKFDFFNVLVRFDKSPLSFSKFKIFGFFSLGRWSRSAPRVLAGLMRTDEKFNDNIRFRL